MSVKLTGAEIKAFYADATFWPDGRWHEDESVSIEGIDQASGFEDVEDYLDEAKIVLEGGIVYDERIGHVSEVCSVESLFKRWRKAQTVSLVMIEVPKDLDAEKLSEALKSIGAKVHK